MATRYGYLLKNWLIQRNWKDVSIPLAEDVIGENYDVEDPITKESMNIWNAVEIERERSGDYPEFI